MLLYPVSCKERAHHRQHISWISHCTLRFVDFPTRRNFTQISALASWWKSATLGASLASAQKSKVRVHLTSNTKVFVQPQTELICSELNYDLYTEKSQSNNIVATLQSCKTLTVSVSSQADMDGRTLNLMSSSSSVCSLFYFAAKCIQFLWGLKMVWVEMPCSSIMTPHTPAEFLKLQPPSGPSRSPPLSIPALRPGSPQPLGAEMLPGLGTGSGAALQVHNKRVIFLNCMEREQ